MIEKVLNVTYETHGRATASGLGWEEVGQIKLDGIVIFEKVLETGPAEYASDEVIEAFAERLGAS